MESIADSEEKCESHSGISRETNARLCIQEGDENTKKTLEVTGLYEGLIYMKDLVLLI